MTKLEDKIGTIIIKLNQDDIQKIIAKHFNIEDINQVEVKPYITSAGYGMCEHEVAAVKAEVLISNSDTEEKLNLEGEYVFRY